MAFIAAGGSFLLNDSPMSMLFSTAVLAGFAAMEYGFNRWVRYDDQRNACFVLKTFMVAVLSSFYMLLCSLNALKEDALFARSVDFQRFKKVHIIRVIVAVVLSIFASILAGMNCTVPCGSSEEASAITIESDDVFTTFTCDAPESGYIEDHGETVFQFVNSETQDVTFTNCRSTFDTQMALYEDDGTWLMDQTANGCDGDDCSDSNYGCDSSYKETFTFEDLAAGTYYLEVGAYTSGGDYEVEAICGRFVSVF